MRIEDFISSLTEIEHRAIDKLTPPDYVARYGLDGDKVRAMLATLSDAEVAFLYYAGAHMAKGCCPKGFRALCDNLGLKMNECVRPEHHARKAAIETLNAAILASNAEHARERAADEGATHRLFECWEAASTTARLAEL